MIAVIERAGVFNGIVYEVAVNQRLPRERLMEMSGGHNRECQHSGHRTHRHADPEESPLQQGSSIRVRSLSVSRGGKTGSFLWCHATPTDPLFAYCPPGFTSVCR